MRVICESFTYLDNGRLRLFDSQFVVILSVNCVAPTVVVVDRDKQNCVALELPSYLPLACIARLPPS